MTHHIKIYAFLLVAMVAFGQARAGGGWPQPKKKGYFKLSQSVLRSSEFFNANGDIIDITTVSLYTSSIYGEYGFTDRLTGIVYAPFFVRSTLNEIERRPSGDVEPGDEVNGVGDFDLTVKYALNTGKKIALSASLTLGLPLGNDGGGRTGLLQTGDGEFNQLLTLYASHSFYPKPIYATVSVGVNNRTDNFSDEFRYGAEVGYTGIKNLVLALKINSIVSFFNGDDEAISGNGVFANNTEFFSFTPEISYGLNDKFGVSASAGLALSGKRILASPNFGFGIYMKL